LPRIVLVFVAVIACAAHYEVSHGLQPGSVGDARCLHLDGLNSKTHTQLLSPFRVLEEFVCGRDLARKNTRQSCDSAASIWQALNLLARALVVVQDVRIPWAPPPGVAASSSEMLLPGTPVEKSARAQLAVREG
jgi:hypothetical protein